MHKRDVLKFPCEFPIKVMGNANDEFEVAVLSIIHKHFPDLTENAIRIRESREGNYFALTITVTATSKEQLDAVYQDLTDCELVVVAL